jgi:hypothetical protein
MKLLKSLALVMLASTAVIFSAADEDTLVTSSSHATASHEAVARGQDALDSVPVHASTMASHSVREAISALTALVDSLADETAQAGLRSIIQSLDTGDTATIGDTLRGLLGDTTTEGDRATLSTAAFILDRSGIGTATTTTTTADAGSAGHEESEDDEAAATAAMVASLVLSNDAPATSTSSSTAAAAAATGQDDDTPATTATSAVQAVVTDHGHDSETPDAVAGTTATSTVPVAEETDEDGDSESEGGDAADAAEHPVASHEPTSAPLTSTETE